MGSSGATGKYKITGDEFFLKGHFKDNPVLPASIMLDGEYGISGVSLSVPVSLGPRGAAVIHECELSGEQHAALRRAADYVRDADAALPDL